MNANTRLVLPNGSRLVRLLVFSALAISLTVGCGSSDQADGPKTKKQTTAKQPVPASGQKNAAKTDTTKDSSATLRKVKFKDGNAKTVYSVKFRADGAKLVDGNEKEVARYNYSEGKVKIKDADDKVLGYIVGDARKLKIEDPTQKIEFFKMQPQDDGDWKLEDPREQLVYRVKKRDYGFELETPDDKRWAKVKSDGGKISLRDAKETTILSTKDNIQPLAVICLGYDVVVDIRIRFGLLVAVQRVKEDW